MKHSLPELRHHQLRLRPLHIDDADALFTLAGDAEVMRYTSLAPQTQARSDALLRRWLTEIVTGRVCAWTLRDADDRFVGQASLFNVDRNNLRAELGYMLLPDAWGKGYGSAAVAALVHFAFEHLGLCRLEADVDPDNVASWRVLEKNHFSREGVLPKRWYKQGCFFDTWLYGLLNEELIEELLRENER